MGMAVTEYGGIRFTQAEATLVRWNRGEAHALRDFMGKFGPITSEKRTRVALITWLMLCSLFSGIYSTSNRSDAYRAFPGCILFPALAIFTYIEFRHKIKQMIAPLAIAHLEINGSSFSIYDYARTLQDNYDEHLTQDDQMEKTEAAYYVIRMRWKQIAPYLEDEEENRQPILV
jgi:hypothetical protein